MTLSEAERAELGGKIRTRRERQFGTKKAAYLAAEVNAATWDKAEAGESVRGDLLRRIVRTLWPETEGDWTLIDVGGWSIEGRGQTLEERVAELERLIRNLANDSVTPQPRDEKPETPDVSA